MTNSISALSPKMIPVAEQFVLELELNHIRFKVTSTLRTLDEQLALYAQGRANLSVVNVLRKRAGLYTLPDCENNHTVTNCDGINNKSNHQGGNAMDVVPLGDTGNPIWPPNNDPRWLVMGKIGESVGLTWGGRWMNPDCPHYEYRG